MSLIDKINELSLQYKDEFGGTSQSVPDWFIADKLNEKPTSVVQKYIPVKTQDIKTVLILGGEYAGIKELSINGTNPIKGLCINALEALTAYEFFDMNNQDFLLGYSEMINNLELAGVISAQSKQTFLNLIIQIPITEYGQSWAEANNLNVDARTVGLARGGI
jgi:hypothetical protein